MLRNVEFSFALLGKIEVVSTVYFLLSTYTVQVHSTNNFSFTKQSKTKVNITEHRLEFNKVITLYKINR